MGGENFFIDGKKTFNSVDIYLLSEFTLAITASDKVIL
jgi:hypothetical protein